MKQIASLNVDHLAGMEVGTSTLVKELARGGMSIIFVAYQRSLKRKIAVKILPKEFLTPKTAALFQQEAESAAILYHPNIIPVYEVGETDSFLFFTMQLIEGETLGQLIKKTKKNIIPSRRILPIENTLGLMLQILDALGYAHEQDIIHRDIKPGNIMVIGDSGRPVVTDFGIAKILRGGDDSKPVIQGTPVYMAPEQILNRNVGRQADIYAAGIMLFQVLAGTLPFPKVKTTMDLLRLKVKTRTNIFRMMPSAMNPALHQDMDEIIGKATRKKQEERFQSCREFADALKDYKANHIG